MNSLMQSQAALLEQTQALRDQLMAILTDGDLAYTLPGDNFSLGALCREMGEIEHIYAQSFKTFKMDFSYRNPEPGLELSVEKLVSWYAKLDDELKAALAGLSEDDIQNKMIDRGDFKPSPMIQFHTYREALLIFYGKASVHLKALGKPLPGLWPDWIG